MLFNRIFLGMLLVNGLFAWFVLSTDVIMGIAYMAPFSIWSFCAYLGKTLPLATVTILLLLSGYYSRKQKQVEVLISATPVSSLCHVLIRTLAAGICFLLICLVVTALALFFYVRFFRFHDFAAFIVPSLLILLPCFVLFAGLGQLLGSLHQSFLYVLMLAAFAAGSIQNVLDVFGAGYFSTYPLTLPPGADGEPAFEMGAAFILVRAMYLAAGAGCIYFTVALSKRKGRRA